jgi:pilus assembly protein CpaC
MPNRSSHPRSVLPRSVLRLALIAAALWPALVEAQVLDRTVIVPVGKSTLVEHTAALRRVSIAEGEIAEAVVVSPFEVLVNGKKTGTTSLVMWGADGSRVIFSVEVTVDAATLERHLRELFPDEQIEVTATGDTYILSGPVTSSSVALRALALAERTGFKVLDNLQVPAPRQILLQVRVAEVNRTAFRELAANFLRLDPFGLRTDTEGIIGTGRATPPAGNFLNDPVGPDQTFSDAVNFYLFNNDSKFGAFIRALQTRGMFKSLAEPNLLALDGREATFLAGGEFPFPVVQAGATSTSISITFKEFGIRLKFTPTITNAGNINLKVAPEVSSLDFASGLTISGFQIPAIRARRAETEVELRDGQTFAIAGLIDHSLSESADRIPFLGDIPILGVFFRSKEARQSQSELLVLVTPHLVEPSATPPPLPTGEPETWDLDKSIREPEDREAGNRSGGGR